MITKKFQETLQQIAGDRIGRMVRSLAAKGDHDAIVAIGCELAHQTAEFLAQRKIGLHLLIGLGVETRHVDRRTHHAVLQVIGEQFGHFESALILRLGSAGSEMRGHDDLFAGAQLVIGGQLRGEVLRGATRARTRARAESAAPCRCVDADLLDRKRGKGCGAARCWPAACCVLDRSSMTYSSCIVPKGIIYSV